MTNQNLCWCCFYGTLTNAQSSIARLFMAFTEMTEVWSAWAAKRAGLGKRADWREMGPPCALTQYMSMSWWDCAEHQHTSLVGCHLAQRSKLICWPQR